MPDDAGDMLGVPESVIACEAVEDADAPNDSACVPVLLEVQVVVGVTDIDCVAEAVPFPEGVTDMLLECDGVAVCEFVPDAEAPIESCCVPVLLDEGVCEGVRVLVTLLVPL